MRPTWITNWLTTLVLTLVAIPRPAAMADDWSTLYGAARKDAQRLSTASLATPLSAGQWQASEAVRREQWLEMLGLSPLPERTPLQATVTGTLDRGDYIVEKIHFQSVPGAYVVGNLYRPAQVKEKLPAVLYLCGHTKGKVNAPYQQNPRWFGQHGYVALVLDPIQLGESQGFHHGTYRGERWDWPSRGYTPAGTEVWNAMRALDYLESRDDVDAERMGVTGLSGGGVISWCLGAADPRVKVVVPVCQSGSIEQVVTDRGTDGHCDCAFWINYYRWCWPDIGSLIAPRALLIAAGSEDVLWRPSGYRDAAQRIRRQYQALDAAEQFDIVEDLSPHGYTPKLRLAIFTWFNTHLKNDPTPVLEDISEYVEPEENLLVFGGNLPQRDRMQQIDRLLVRPGTKPETTNLEQWQTHQQSALKRLRETTFRNTQSLPEASLSEFRSDGEDYRGIYGTYEFSAADGLSLGIKTRLPVDAPRPVATVVFAMPADEPRSFTGGGSARPALPNDIATAAVEVRNTAATSVGPGYLWTARRTYPLLGQTLPERQVSDLLAALTIVGQQSSMQCAAVYGSGHTAPLALYAALLDETIPEVILANCPTSHEDPTTGEFLGVLRVGDLPHNLSLLYPRAITFIGEMPSEFAEVRELYQRWGHADRFRVLASPQAWRPAER